jgi:peroxiredoxin
MFARTKTVPVPEVGSEAPEFHLPSAQGGQLRLGMRTARGPVVVVFYRTWSEEDAEYFRALAQKEEEINLAAASVVGIGVSEPDDAREFVRASGIKSYVLYDYARVATRQWGLLEEDKEHGEYARPAVFIVGTDRNVAHAWVGERPEVDEILTKVSEITGLPKPPEEVEEEKPKKTAKDADAAEESEQEEDSEEAAERGSQSEASGARGRDEKAQEAEGAEAQESERGEESEDEAARARDEKDREG